MKKLAYFTFLAVLFECIVSCAQSRFESVISKYNDGSLELDSVLSYITDSLNYDDVNKWSQENLSNDINARYIRAYYLEEGILQDKNIPLAITLYKADELENKDGHFAYALARAYNKENKSDSMVYWLEKAVVKQYKHAYGLLARLNSSGFADLNGNILIKPNVAKAVELAEIGISKGDDSSKESLALIYYSGSLGDQKKQESFTMLSSIPNDKLSSEGLFVLSLMYGNGDGVVMNLEKSFEYCLKSAEKGNPEAMNNLGVAYHMGIGIEKNDTLAFKWYNKAANSGNSMAMSNVGHCYHNGIGVSQNAYVAIEWYKRSAKQGESAAIEYLNSVHIPYE